MDQPFTNPDRTRYYGLREGDICKNAFGHFPELVEVVSIASSDNNRVYVRKVGTDEVFGHVAEWLTIVKKVDE